MSEESEKGEKATFVSLAAPIYIELLLIFSKGFVELYFLSRIGEVAVAGYSAIYPVITICIVILKFMSQGCAALLSRHHGADDEQKISDVRALGLMSSLMGGILISFALILWRSQIVRAIGLADLPAHSASSYSLGYAVVLGVLSLRFPLAAFAATVGNTRVSLEGYSICTVFTISVNYMLLLNKHLADPVLALSLVTAGGYCIDCIYLFVRSRRLISSRGAGHTSFKQMIKNVPDFLKVVLPSTLEPLLFNIYLLFLTLLIAKRGEAALSARAYVYQLSSSIFFFSLAVAQSNQILVARTYGAADVRLLKARVATSRMWGCLGSLFMAVCLLILSRPILSLMTNDGVVINLASILFAIGLVLEPARSMNAITNFTLMAIGDGQFIFLVGAAMVWLIGLPLAFALSDIFEMGLVGIWIAIALDEFSRAIVGFFRYRIVVRAYEASLEGQIS